jgi:hypothetical protein
MSHRTTRSLRVMTRSLLVATILAIAACHDGNPVAPPPSPGAFDAVHALAQVEPVDAVFDQPIFTSFTSALSFFETYLRSTPGTFAMAASRNAIGFELRANRTIASIARIDATDIPANVKGKTLVYDPATRTYVIDPTETGALPDAVRYVLYAIDPNTGQPSLPLVRIGSVDLASASDGSVGAPQRVEVVLIRDRPRLVAADFVVMHGVTNGVNTFSIEGSSTDGLTSDDDILVQGTEGGGDGHHHLVYDLRIASTSSGVRVVEQLTFDQATATQGGKLELRYDGHRFSDENVGSGIELRFDDGLYARVIFPTTAPDTPQYLRPDGTPLPAKEILDLNALLLRAVSTNFFWINLAFP